MSTRRVVRGAAPVILNIYESDSPAISSSIQQRVSSVRTARFHEVRLRPDIIISGQSDTPGIHDLHAVTGEDCAGNMRMSAEHELPANAAQPLFRSGQVKRDGHRWR